LQRVRSFEDGIQESFRDILSRSPYIFAANKRQEALLDHAASLEKPSFKFTSSMPSQLPVSITNNVSPPHGDRPLLPVLSRSPKRAAAAVVTAAVARTGRCSAPPDLGAASGSGALANAVDRRGKQAVLERMERLRNDDEALMLLHQKVERYMARQREQASPGRQSPILKNRREVKLQTLENRVSKLDGQRLVTRTTSHRTTRLQRRLTLVVRSESRPWNG
jgi:hypothetical protein